MDDKTHDGWTNYETWAVAIWLDSDQDELPLLVRAGASDTATSRHDCQAGASRACGRPEEAAKYNLADQLKEEITEDAPDVFKGAYSDLLGAALGRSQLGRNRRALSEKRSSEAKITLRSRHLQLQPRPGHRRRRAGGRDRDRQGSRA